MQRFLLDGGTLLQQCSELVEILFPVIMLIIQFKGKNRGELESFMFYKVQCLQKTCYWQLLHQNLQ